MTGTTAVAANTIDQVAALRAEERQAAGIEYRGLLLRSAHPQTGDAEALARCMELLDRQPTDLREDADLVQRLLAAEDAAGHVEALRASAKAARLAVKQLVEKRDTELAKIQERFDGQIRAAGKEAGTAQAKLMSTAETARNVGQLRDALAARGLADGLPPRPPRAVPSASAPARASIIDVWRRRAARGERPLENTAAKLFEAVNFDLSAAGLPALTASEIVAERINRWIEHRGASRPRDAVLAEIRSSVVGGATIPSGEVREKLIEAANLELLWAGHDPLRLTEIEQLAVMQSVSAES